jgi:hypothetical protein
VNCDDAREILWPPERPKAADERLVAARRHVDECAECRTFLKWDLELRERLGSIVLPAAPASLRERVYQALARERAALDPEDRDGGGHADRDGGGPEDRDGRRADPRVALRSRVAPFAVAVAVSAFLFVGGWLAFGSDLAPGGDGVPSSAGSPVGADQGEVEGFVRYAVQDVYLASSDPLAVSGFIVRELALPFQPREFHGFDLLGAEICVKDWKRGAVLMYERDGALLFHYVLQVQGARAGEPTLSEATPEEWPGRPGPSAVVWSSPGTEQALVADLPAGELLTLARSVGRGF